MNIVKTSRGDIEYRLEGTGNKVALLLYGGHTNAKTHLGEDYFMERGYKVLAVSRPGYGKTPLATGRTPDEFADALFEMLEILKIPRILVVGISAGGRTAIRFAARHAGMTDKLSSKVPSALHRIRACSPVSAHTLVLMASLKNILGSLCTTS